ncbi:DUF4386 domain-containing protein [Salinibacterium sp. G-O1]|uniref:DUF4386 domain-containing protein n=1 Tax=Salinibacterium sp. G-O1 TaxID=3046208 RepID=UPI0024BB8055|nr:DUF4386 domain-containing protein [Salinibacterium sp. G-O1]MDJ0334041.1 DUF4386 domain-containing protein [Salinibacterium sp. G-O1]
MNPSARIARLTGVAYLTFLITGLLSQLVIRPQLEVMDDPVATLANILERSEVANAAVALELFLVLTQALVALGFFALFHRERPVAAYAVATFGVANSLVLLASSAMLSAATHGASTAALAPAGDAAAGVALLFSIYDSLWAAGPVFFGLWLLPMGWFMISTRRMPVSLGWVLIVGGGGFILSALIGAALPALPSIIRDTLLVPATVGELWTIAYLLIWAIRPAPATHVPTMQSAR